MCVVKGGGVLIKVGKLFDYPDDHKCLKGDCPMELTSEVHSYTVVFCALLIAYPAVLCVHVMRRRNYNSEFQSDLFA